MTVYRSTTTTNGAGIITPTDLGIYRGALGGMNYDSASGKVSVQRHRGSRVPAGDLVRGWMPLDNPKRLPGTLTWTRDSAALNDSNMPHSASLPFAGGDAVNRIEVITDPDAGIHGVSRKVLHFLAKKTDTLDANNTLRYEVGGLYQGGIPSAVTGEFEENVEYTSAVEFRLQTGMRSCAGNFEFAYLQQHYSSAPGDYGVSITGGSSLVFRAGGSGNENLSTLRSKWTGNQISPWRNDTTFRSDYTLGDDQLCYVTADTTWICVVSRWCLSSYTSAQGGRGYLEAYVRFGGPGNTFTKVFDTRTQYGGYIVNAMRHQTGYYYNGHEGAYLYNSDAATHPTQAPTQTELWYSGALTYRGLMDPPTATAPFDVA